MPEITADDIAGERAEEIRALAAAATASDAVAPFNEDTLLSLGERRLTSLDVDGRLVAAALTRTVDGGDIEGELVVHPEARGQGFGTQLLEASFPPGDAQLVLWAHGDLPAARALATRHALQSTRTLLKLGRAIRSSDAQAADLPQGVSIGTFGDADAPDFLALNALVFRDHPEQGALDARGLDARRSTEWYDADDFLLLRDEDGALLGYNWLKREGDEVEIYVVGVAPSAAGRGLGRALMEAGLARMHASGAARTSLYVEGDNDAALALYRSLGYEQLAIDVQYRSSRS